MARPVVSDVAEEMYASLGPLTIEDERLGWPLLHFCEAVGQQLQSIEDIVRDDPSGRPGWASVMDAALAPAEWLDWLGQFIGVTPNPTITEEQKRLELTDAAGWKRGTRAAIEAAVKRVLTGTKWSMLLERTTSAYRAEVRTRYDESPSREAVLEAANAVKPAGIILDHAFGLQPVERMSWRESTTRTVYACPVPSENLYPSEALYPC